MWNLCLLIFFITTDICYANNVLHNGIVLPEIWPPQRDIPQQREIMPVPYLEHKPKVIPINVGRQLFVDDFLIAESDLETVYHTPEWYSGNPVLEPDQDWELTRDGAPYAAPFSDGIWYDEQNEIFRMWYLAGAGKVHRKSNQTFYTCYAESEDGIHWSKAKQDVIAGTNIVELSNRDSSTVWLDRQERNPSKRTKIST
jgi:hypothetical protein